jgi:hypothetical protein
MDESEQPFTPELINPRFRGLYTVPDRLKPKIPISDLQHRTPQPDGTGGWITDQAKLSSDIERLANGLLAMLQFYGHWCGISKTLLDVAIKDQDPDVFRWISAPDPSGMVTALLSMMEKDGLVEQIPRKKDGVLVIYLTSRLLDQIKI